MIKSFTSFNQGTNIPHMQHQNPPSQHIQRGSQSSLSPLLLQEVHGKVKQINDSVSQSSLGIGRQEGLPMREGRMVEVTSGKIGSPSCENRGGMVSATSRESQESEKMKHLRQHLLTLLHAHKCQQAGLMEECKVLFCATMRSVLEHMKICRVGGQWQCPVPHCTSSCKILAHWKSCKKHSCRVCAPLKQPNSTAAVLPYSRSPSQSNGNFAGHPLQQHQGSPALEQMSMIASKPTWQSSGGNHWEKSQDQNYSNGGDATVDQRSSTTTKPLVKNILPTNIAVTSNVEKGNAGDKDPVRHSIARKEPKRTCESSIPSSNGSVPQAAEPEASVGYEAKVKVTFSATDMRTALLPPLEKLYAQDPESEPFRNPVDPVALGIEGYFDVVKKPMDLSKIRRKLEVGGYLDPWQFIGDVNLMLENAWLYNKKNSRVYKYTSKVKQWDISVYNTIPHSWLKYLRRRLTR